jgi:hypothetical protein
MAGEARGRCAVFHALDVFARKGCPRRARPPLYREARSAVGHSAKVTARAHTSIVETSPLPAAGIALPARVEPVDQKLGQELDGAFVASRSDTRSSCIRWLRARVGPCPSLPRATAQGKQRWPYCRPHSRTQSPL